MSVDFSLILDEDEADAVVKNNLENNDAFQGGQLIDDVEADNAMETLLWAQNLIDENNSKVENRKKQLLEQLEDWRHRLNNRLEYVVEKKNSQLFEYAKKQLQNKKGAIKLFHGNLKLANPRPKVDYIDEKALTEWLKKHEKTDCYKEELKLNKVIFKSSFKLDNSGSRYVYEDEMTHEKEFLPGVEVTTSQDLDFSIQLPKKTAVK